MSYHVSICEYVNLWHVMANVANNLPLRDGTHMIQWDPSIRNRKSEGLDIFDGGVPTTDTGGLESLNHVQPIWGDANVTRTQVVPGTHDQ